MTIRTKYALMTAALIGSVVAAITESLTLSVMDAASGAETANMPGLMELGLVLETP